MRVRLAGNAAVCPIEHDAVEAGGATMFSALGIEITPQPGVLLIWNNALPDGCPNEATLHVGLPVERGVKTSSP
ncbi:MAG: hypothetical protein U1D66_00255, partial [Erythrobacter sp.]|nr:hypothetical protein [Erythrobacter sp.]